MVVHMSDNLTRCAHCGCLQDDNWPCGDGGTLCQMCWEIQCSESWWQMVQLMEATE